MEKVEGNLRQVGALEVFSVRGADVEGYIGQDRLACGIRGEEGFESKLGEGLATETTEHTEKDNADLGSGVLCALCGIRGEYLEFNPTGFGE